jgi:hypothetical protein
MKITAALAQTADVKGNVRTLVMACLYNPGSTIPALGLLVN